MKKLFVAGVLLIALFEVAAVWFIMPLPYSQHVRSIDVAYALYRWRWAFRAIALGMIVAGLPAILRTGRWTRSSATVGLVASGLIVYLTNFRMSADHMFIMPEHVRMSPMAANVVDTNRLVVGITLGSEARAYPVQFIGYHHQVQDSIAGRPILVTFCTVCRTGRVFDPVVNGKLEHFRLVGMDHFNAMLEDESTGSWWRQANGEAIGGPSAGKTLAELPSAQMTLASWRALHPNTYVMQPDSALMSLYGKSFDYETGASRSSLTGTDTASWHDKSWVVGVTHNSASRAYDWNRLRHERAINDTLGGTPVVIVLARDNASFAAFVRPSAGDVYSMRADSIASGTRAFDLGGRGASDTLRAIPASQEYWHSWRTFQPATTKY